MNVRFIAATNRDLEAEVEVGRFRRDLYFRLNGVRLTIPPLRERVEEIEPLVATFVRRACLQLDRKADVTVTPDLLQLLQRYSWPGNVRELRNVVERAVVLSTQTTLSRADLPLQLLSAVDSSSRALQATSRAPSHASEVPRDIVSQRSMRDEIRSLERERIVSALHRCGGNQTQTAKVLGISRRTLTTRLAEFALPRPRKPRDARD